MACKLVAEGGGGCSLPRRDEDRVVAGEGAGDEWMTALVDRLGQRVRVARRRREDDEAALSGLDGEGVAAHRGPDRAELVGVARALGRIDEPAARRAHLHEPELRDVA